MKDLKRDWGTGDLVTPIQWVTGAELFRQRLALRFSWVRGEWFRDQRQGIPWFEIIFRKNPDPRVLTYVLRQAILTMPGCERLRFFNLNYDKSTRTLNPEFEAILTDGSTFRLQGGEFIINIPGDLIDGN